MRNQTSRPRVSVPQWDLLVEAIGWMCVGIIELSLSGVINDWLIQYRYKTNMELLKGNMAVALIQAGGFIATALNVRATLVGGGCDDQQNGFAVDLGSSFLFWFIGQVCITLYALLFQVSTCSYDDQVRRGEEGGLNNLLDL